jgi:hypothetical protein
MARELVDDELWEIVRPLLPPPPPHKTPAGRKRAASASTSGAYSPAFCSSSGYRPELLALCLMRSAFETEWGFWQQGKFAELRDVPAFGVESYESRIPRLAWRAMFLGIYASWYFQVKRLMRKGVLIRTDVSGGPMGNPFMFFKTWSETEENGEEWRFGEVVFPEIDFLTSILRRHAPQKNITL